MPAFTLRALMIGGDSPTVQRIALFGRLRRGSRTADLRSWQVAVKLRAGYGDFLNGLKWTTCFDRPYFSYFRLERPRNSPELDPITIIRRGVPSPHASLPFRIPR